MPAANGPLLIPSTFQAPSPDRPQTNIFFFILRFIAEVSITEDILKKVKFVEWVGLLGCDASRPVIVSGLLYCTTGWRLTLHHIFVQRNIELNSQDESSGQHCSASLARRAGYGLYITTYAQPGATEPALPD